MEYELANIRQFAIQKGYEWVKSIQALYENNSRKLTFGEKEKLKNWFSGETLDDANIATITYIEDPPFLEELKKILPISFNYRDTAGATFGNLVLIAGSHIMPGHRKWLSVLFHELVHVVQSSQLGVQKWVEVYVDGVIANNFTYNEDIPLERIAYNLQGRFDAYPERYFPVEDEVKTFLEQFI